MPFAAPRGMVDPYKTILLPVGLTTAVGLGFLAGRFLEEGRPVPAQVQMSPLRETKTPAAPKAAPPALATRAAAAREERLAHIDYELSALPDDSAAALKALAGQIREEQARQQELRARLRESDRALLYEAASSGVDPRSGQLDVELAQAELQQELTDAQVAVREQEWYLNTTVASDQTKELLELREELARRKLRVAEIDERLRSLIAGNRQSLDAGAAQRASRLQAWRGERATLEAAYADSLGALSVRNQAYQRLAGEATQARRREEQLRQERKALEEGGGLGGEPAR